ncbi:hypothetical protein BC827DRAFT_418369 [Russula dissimulans]|nr:hypothetical protein BC827DRAFT_418369 [Russula dissimulans]
MTGESTGAGLLSLLNAAFSWILSANGLVGRPQQSLLQYKIVFPCNGVTSLGGGWRNSTIQASLGPLPCCADAKGVVTASFRFDFHASCLKIYSLSEV